MMHECPLCGGTKADPGELYTGIPCICASFDAMYERGFRAGQEAAIQACKDECVDADATGEESDHVYNMAIADCIEAIRALPIVEAGKCS